MYVFATRDCSRRHVATSAPTATWFEAPEEIVEVGSEREVF